MASSSDFQFGSQPAQTPEIVSKLIRFSLSELSVENGHHAFEHLCRHLARRRICSNIIPATGPVSGGGDKGADFETIQVFGTGASTYWQLASAGKVIFACSLEQNLKKKVRADLQSAAAFSEPLERMYFFYNRPIKVGDRNKLKEEASTNYGIKLEIVDAVAIAEYLADPELLWIAEKYLNLPSEVSLPPSGSAPEWYSTLLSVPEKDLWINADTFYQIKSALRYARANPDHHSEIPKLVERVRRFRKHPDGVIARKAFYEEFVAVLRGLNAAEGYEDQVIEYLLSISETNEPTELEDAVLMLSYANGACDRNILNIDDAQRIGFRDSLLAKLDSRITQEPSFVNCSLLFNKGYLLLVAPSPEDTDKHGNESFIAKRVERAVSVWTTLLKHSGHVAFYPVERLRSLITLILPLDTSEKFTDFIKKFDALIAERAGTQALAEQVVERASALLDAKQYLRALQEFHEALLLSQSLESQQTAVTICLQLAALYHHIGLHHASKYYGLAGAYAALRLPEDELRKYSPVGLSLAAQADYATGASLLFFLTCKVFVWLTHQYSMVGEKNFREHEWGKIDYYALLLTESAKVISEQLHTRRRNWLKQLGIEDIYEAAKSDLEVMFKDLDASAMQERFAAEGISIPFCDYASSRKTAWKQLGVIWSVEWNSTYDSEQYGETICAALQIIFAALAGIEFSVIATAATIELNTEHSGNISLKQVPDNNTVRFRMSVDPKAGMDLHDYLTLAYLVLSMISAIPSDDFKVRFEEKLKHGLVERVAVYISLSEAFRQFYAQEDYRDIHSTDPQEAVFHALPTKTWNVISEVSTIHPDFNENEALEIIRNRYRRSFEMFPYTIAQLSSDSTFRKLVQELRNEGWKDWHILLALGNVRVSSFLNNSKFYQDLAKDVARNGERKEYPLTPSSFFDRERLKICLETSQLSTLNNMGFRVDQMTPNFKGIDAFLRRFKYWELDVPHENPFPEAKD